MKAAQISAYGSNDMIEIKEADKPRLKKGHLLVHVHAAGINPFEISIRNGYLQENMPFTMPITLGGDYAGTVEEVGEEVTGFQVGDTVYGQGVVASGGSGTLAPYAVVNARSSALKPAISFELSASLPLAGVSALQALTEHVNLQSGQKILIHGGAGGIGTLAIQIAKHLGAHVTTTVSQDDSEFVRSLGADETIDYKSQKFEEMLKDFDAVFDTVGGDVTDRSYHVLRKGGILVSMIGTIDQLRASEKSIVAVLQMTKVTTERLNHLSELVNKGAVKPVVDTMFPLEQAREAYELLEHGSPRGKVVVTISSH